jgi:hypothetical protein
MKSAIGDILQLLVFVLIVSIPAIIKFAQKRARKAAEHEAATSMTQTQGDVAPRKPQVLSVEPAPVTQAKAESIEDILAELFGGKPVQPAVPPPPPPIPVPFAPLPESQLMPAPAADIEAITAWKPTQMPSEISSMADRRAVPLARYEVAARELHPILHNVARHGISEWRRAIVLKEVLDAPLALRDPR